MSPISHESCLLLLLCGVGEAASLHVRQYILASAMRAMSSSWQPLPQRIPPLRADTYIFIDTNTFEQHLQVAKLVVKYLAA